MRSLLKNLWSSVHNTLWFVPAVLTTLAAGAAFALMAIEERGLVWRGSPPEWVYRDGAEGARTVLSAITAGLVTVTGVLFSVTIVAVQLASSQYSPRVLRNFTSDRGNQLVLGLFIGTFTYGALVLRAIRSPDAVGGEFVPRLAITVAVALLAACVGALIYFIHHVSREIHVTAILDRITKETMGNVHRLFPEHVGRADDAPPPDPRLPEQASARVRATRSGYVHYVDGDALFDVGVRERIAIGMEPKIGDYVLAGRPLAAVRSDAPLTEEVAEAIRRAFVLGPERTPQQDVEFGMIQISDIAIKALSPSINDPTTAIRCIDRLSEILAELGTRRPPEPRRTRDGMVRFVASYTTFEQAVKIAYDEIRHFGAPVPVIAQELLERLGELVALVPASRRGPLLDQARAVLHTAREKTTNPRDLAALEKAAERFRGEEGW